MSACLPIHLVDAPRRCEVRFLRVNEEIPAGLDTGFEQLGHLDRHWVWVLDVNHKIEGVLLAAPCHGVAFVWRLCVLPNSSTTDVLRLLRGFLASCRERGLVGYMTLMDLAQPTQERLRGLIERAGGIHQGDFSLMVSAIPKEGT